jgi:hypothetical protein
LAAFGRKSGRSAYAPVADIRFVATLWEVSPLAAQSSRLFQRGFLVAVALLATSCSSSYPIEVTFINGKVAFSASKRLDGCLNYLEVKSESGELMWRFEGPFRHSECHNDFPLIYGSAPQSAASSTCAKRLLPDIRYYVAASDGDSYYGSFRVRRVLSIESDPKEGRNGPYFNSQLNGVDAMTEPPGNGN